MKIGLFGGSFNPIHIGHLLVAERAIETLKLDKLIIVPAAQNPFKRTEGLAPGEHRLQMAKLAIMGMSKAEVWDYEVKKGKKSYTIDTVQQLQKNNKAIYGKTCQIFLIVGSDAFNSLPRWHEANKLKKLVTFALAERPGYNTDDGAGSVFATPIKIDVPNINISASDIRQRLKDCRSVKFLVPDAVGHYIRQNKLYNVQYLTK